MPISAYVKSRSDSILVAADVAKLTIYLREGVDVTEAFAASRAVWGDQPTAVSAIFVRGLAVPGAVIEIDVIAAIPG